MKLLIVEDEHTIGEHILERLRACGYTCDWVKNGAEAMESIGIDNYDCIILDRKLPDIDGIAICRQIRLQGNETPIIILTALADVEQRVAGLEAGADDYLTKPFAMDELIARVQAVMRRISYRNNPKLKIRNIQLDSISRTVQVDDKQVSVSNREFLILEYIMRNSGKALTRLQILDHVWESNMDTDTNLVDVYINYIRKKIDSDLADQSNIETIRGYGYRFRDDS